ncbi:cation-translocating P-type ATPase [Nocardia sp. alder85J]|uniref:cation-translocating P-type ATPase n=1 Tax=Nocardia sp. alder85J TaxID=2862949 RepID=UPI001CD74768|nr:cation-translocating P-type ATPase [Nocardia sp. alder85J]MCX4092480.1 cation-translocating P-type ATPase [Nocardia sp. alder85J]
MPGSPIGSTLTTAGLTSTEAADRLARQGPNVLPQAPSVRWWQRIAAQLRDPLIVVLLVAAILTAVTADWTDMAVILLVVVANTAVGVVQEIRADHAIAALSQLTAPAAEVVRDGVRQEVPAAEVVVGDVLALAEGDIVAADAAVIEAAALRVDESALTGESVPVDKAVAGDDALFAGTVVVKGRGRAVVTAVGAASATGRIARLLDQGGGPTPLQRRLVDVGRLLAGVTVALCVIVLISGLVRGEPVELMAVTAISLAVAAVPESLPAVVTLGLAVGARRMAARHALIRTLPAVETLGAVTVLATDKTGTLTEGRMVARQIWTNGTEAVVTGSGYAPTGEVRVGGRVVTASDAPDVTLLLTAAAQCNDAHLTPPAGDGEQWTALGDPTEIALLSAAGKFGMYRDDVDAALPRIAERPFDSDRKRMSTIHRLAGGQVRVVCKGAPEAVLNPDVLADDPVLLARATERADRLAHDGYRVLALAQADRETPPAAGTDPEQGLRLLGLIAIVDPPRTTAGDTISACRQAGIRPVLITGDHPGTARAIATEVGIIGAGDPVVDCRSEGTLAEASVYARATPAQKLTIVAALRDSGDIVAMNGDGVNDGPALRRADIGVAMGGRGTEVARQAADLVLADDDLGTVVAAVEEGRRIYANIRRFLVYGLAGGAAEIAVMLAGPFLGLTLPLLPAQILWINLLTHGLPGVALGGEPADPGLMQRQPRPPTQSILAAGLWQRVVRIAIVLTAATVGVAVWADHTGRPWQTMAFFTLGATQLGAALGSRARPRSLANPMLLIAVTVALGLQLAALYLPLLRGLLGTEPLTGTDLLVVACLSTLGYVAVRLDRVLHPSRRNRSSSGIHRKTTQPGRSPRAAGEEDKP